MWSNIIVTPKTDDAVVFVSYFIMIIFAPLFFWIRGLTKGSKGDMLLGAVLLFAGLFLLMLSMGGNAFAPFALACLMFSLATLFYGGPFARPKCPLKKDACLLLALIFFLMIFAGTISLKHYGS